jgi:putative GTP pyrophosphokinase
MVRVPTNSQVNRAGQTIRSLLVEAEPWSDDRLRSAYEVLVLFRAAHQYPLIKANMGLRSVLRTEGCGVEVTQRLKRIPTIVDKLRREPTMQLAKMQDIGGCRAILRSVAEIRNVERRLCRNRPPLRVSDYIEVPQASGYRAVHVVVSYPDEDGVARAIEVQLRTRIMHEWAVSVERLGGRIEADLKSGLGPRPVLDFLRTASAAMAIEEAGGTVARELEAEVVALRAAAMPYLEGTSGRSQR